MRGARYQPAAAIQRLRARANTTTVAKLRTMSAADAALLFFSAFGAATVLPLFSEAVLLALLTQGSDPLLLWLVASAGNSLGSVVNWALGRGLLQLRFFQQRDRYMAHARRWFQRYGQWSLLLAWLPVGGDALTVVAGTLRLPFLNFLVLVTIGKALRYAVFILAFLQLT